MNGTPCACKRSNMPSYFWIQEFQSCWFWKVFMALDKCCLRAGGKHFASESCKWSHSNIGKESQKCATLIQKYQIHISIKTKSLQTKQFSHHEPVGVVMETSGPKQTSAVPVAQVTGFRQDQRLKEVLHSSEHAALQQWRVDQSEDSWQHRGADLSQRGRTGFGHAAQQGNGHLETDTHTHGVVQQPLDNNVKKKLSGQQKKSSKEVLWTCRLTLFVASGPTGQQHISSQTPQ